MATLIVNFYKFTPLTDVPAWRARIQAEAEARGLKGSVYVAAEGINAGLAGDEAALEAFLTWLGAFPEFAGLDVKRSGGDEVPFGRLLVKEKAAILTFPAEFAPSVDEILAGPRLSPAEWDEALARGDAVLVDTRNDYEVAEGSFAGATHLGVDTFGAFPAAFLERYGEAKDKTYLMFCTGGIRCEKAVAFARNAGFERVFQLEGGIINYFRERGRGHWRGACFVFDERGVIGPELGGRET